MPIRSLAFTLLVTGFACGASISEIEHDTDAAERLTGIWEGAIEAGVRLRLVVHLEVKDGALVASLDSPDQGVTGIPVDTVKFDGEQFVLSAPRIGATYEARLLDDKLKGTWRQNAATLELDLERVDAITKMNRPQSPQPPYPYTEHAVTFESTDAVLKGTLTLPAGDGPFPAALLVSGSGPQDRDETLFEHRPFKVIADHLTRNGIAVLRYDDRGVGESTGDFASATTATFAGDALAGITALHKRNDIADVGIIGHSEGAIIADLAARQADSIAWTVRLAGPAVSGRDLLIAQSAAILEASGASQALLATAAAFNVPLYDLAASGLDTETMLSEARRHVSGIAQELDETTLRQLGVPQDPTPMLAQLASPWFRFFARHDPADDIGALEIPVLALFGAKDLQVPPNQSADLTERLLTHDASRVKVYPDLNHLFQESRTGLPAEYGSIEQTIAPVVLDDLVSWIRAR